MTLRQRPFLYQKPGWIPDQDEVLRIVKKLLVVIKDPGTPFVIIWEVRDKGLIVSGSSHGVRWWVNWSECLGLIGEVEKPVEAVKFSKSLIKRRA